MGLPTFFHQSSSSSGNHQMPLSSSNRKDTGGIEVGAGAAPATDGVALKRSYDFLFKILLCGDPSVGKTALIHRFCEGVFSTSYVTTLGIDFKIKTIQYDGRIVKLQIWDPAGQDRFNELIRAYFRGAHAVVFVYDITRKATYERIRNWVGRVQDELGASFNIVPKILVGNKCDDELARQVTSTQGEEIAYFLRMRFMETSVLLDQNVSQVFTNLVHDLVIQREFEIQNGILTIENDPNRRGFTLSRKDEKTVKTNCAKFKDRC